MGHIVYGGMHKSLALDIDHAQGIASMWPSICFLIPTGNVHYCGDGGSLRPAQKKRVTFHHQISKAPRNPSLETRSIFTHQISKTPEGPTETSIRTRTPQP